MHRSPYVTSSPPLRSVLLAALFPFPFFHRVTRPAFKDPGIDQTVSSSWESICKRIVTLRDRAASGSIGWGLEDHTPEIDGLCSSAAHNSQPLRSFYSSLALSLSLSLFSAPPPLPPPHYIPSRRTLSSPSFSFRFPLVLSTVYLYAYVKKHIVLSHLSGVSR